MTRTRRVAAAALLTLALSVTGSTPAMALAPRGGYAHSQCWANAAVISPLFGLICRYHAELLYR